MQVYEAEGSHTFPLICFPFLNLLSITSNLLYVRRIGQFLDIPSKVALPVYQDNTSTIIMAYMGKGSAQSNSKFMDLKYFWIKEQ